MGINLGGNAPILNLQKNDILDLTKRNPGLKKVTLGAGWDVSQGGVDFDIDIAAFLLDANNKFNTVSNVIFFNNKQGQGIALSGDNRTGAGEGDDETILMDLEAINSSIQKIVFVVTIHEAQSRRQTFGMVNNSYVRVLDAANGDRQLCIYPLKEQYAVDTAVIVAELVRNGADWEFKALGEGKQGDLNALAAMYF
jgi:tellurium resistance protein TerD